MKEYILKPNYSLKTNSRIDFNELNAAQFEAVTTTEGPVLVIAGAGSGKTKTLVYRLAYLVQQGVSPESILLLTFTKKSSQEMLRRAASILDHRCEHVSGGTFHSFANVVLRHFSDAIGYSRSFTILDRSDADELIGLIRSQLAHVKTDKRFPKKSTIGAIISMAVNTTRTIPEVVSTEYPQFIDYTEDIDRIRVGYQTQKKTGNVMDYDDLLVKLVELLASNSEIRSELQRTYSYIMVDEYQDTNRVQSQIIEMLVNNQRNIMAVGDDAQSIYSFRGAHFKNIIDFPRHYDGCRVIALEQNYRSSQPILNLTNAVIRSAAQHYEKTLFTDRPDGQLPVVVETPDENTQSRFVAQHILSLRENGIALRDIVVLVRSGWHSNDLEVELQSRNIPFQKFGGFKFIETAHVKDVLAYLRLIQNSSDVVSWTRVLQLIDGVGPKAAAEFWDALSEIRRTGDLPRRFIQKKYGPDLQTLTRLIFGSMSDSPGVTLDRVIEYYTPLFRVSYDDHSKRVSDLDSLRSIAGRFSTLDLFLSEISLEPPDQHAEAVADDFDDEKMTISTIHSAKGLEWKVVFVISAVDGFIPSFQSLGDMAQLEEERRLLYVALTRAKDQLYIVKPNLDGASGAFNRFPGITFSKVSRFLEDLISNGTYTEKWILRDERPKRFGLKPRSTPALPEFGDDAPPPDPSRKKYFF